MSGKRGLFLLVLVTILVTIIVSSAASAQVYSTRYECNNAGGIWCGNTQRCFLGEELIIQGTNLVCRIDESQVIDVAASIGASTIIYFEELEIASTATLQFLDSSKSTPKDWFSDCIGCVDPRNWGTQGFGDGNLGKDGGVGGSGALKNNAGQSGEQGNSQLTTYPRGGLGGRGGYAGATIGIYVQNLILYGTLSANGENGLSGVNGGLNTDGGNFGHGGGGGGGGGGAGEIYVYAVQFSGSGSITAKGGNGGRAGSGRYDSSKDNNCGWHSDDGGSGGGGGGGDGGNISFLSGNGAQLTYNVAVGSGGNGRYYYDPYDCVVSEGDLMGENGGSGRTAGSYQLMPSVDVIFQKFGSSIVETAGGSNACNDEVSNDGDVPVDMADNDCQIPPHCPDFKLENLLEPSANNGRDGCCGDDSKASCSGNLPSYCGAFGSTTESECPWELGCKWVRGCDGYVDPYTYCSTRYGGGSSYPMGCDSDPFCIQTQDADPWNPSLITYTCEFNWEFYEGASSICNTNSELCLYDYYGFDCEWTDYFCNGTITQTSCLGFGTQDLCNEYAPYCDWNVTVQATRANLLDYGFISDDERFICHTNLWKDSKQNKYKILTLDVN